MNSIINNLIKTKSPDELIATSKKTELKKTLNILDLIVIGIGAVVGTGIFTVIGVAVAGGPEGPGAGPAIVVSMLLAVVACVFSALCYSEIAAMIPVAGSAYTYTYATLGEFAAWMVGWILMLEYAIGNITVASAWTGYLTQLLRGFKDVLPDFITHFPIWLRMDYRSITVMCEKFGMDTHDKMPYLFGHIPVAVNLPSVAVVVLLTVLLVKGVKESTRFASVMVALNLVIICSFIVVGSFYVKPENWTPFAPNGFEGVFMGAFLIFFAYIGFDAISTTAEETENPQRDLPIGILGTLAICTILYIGVALVLTGTVPFTAIDTQAPIAHAMSYIGKDWFAGLISTGALAGLTSVLLIYQLGTTRILYAMSRDRFLPKSLRVIHKKYRTPHVLTWIAGGIVIFCALFMDLNISAELCNFGTFTSFIIICIALLILRKTEPNRPRPFKVPFSPVFPILGILSCGGLMFYSMKFLTTSSIYFPLWLLIGLIIYVAYGYKQKRLEENSKS
ncbi:MAG: amino acid permease [Heliobacteriaceae bacterium]|jgi:APA family basic amino acid/polyamine antiporter|nr:amino acid permease [Heliobacteriaceae bacterium]